MKITKRQLRRLIREEKQRFYEAEFYDETPEGQLLGTEAEDVRFNRQVQFEKDLNSFAIQAVKDGITAEDAVSALEQTAKGWKSKSYKFHP